MTEEIDAVMLDVGGTMVDLSPPRERIWWDLLAKHGLKVELGSIARALAKADGALDAEFASLDGRDESPFWAKYDSFVLKELGLDDVDKHFSAEAGEVFDTIIPRIESWAEYPDARPILDMVANRDLVVGVISNATDLARRVLDHLDLSKYFDVMVLSDEVGVRKPSKRIFQIAAEEAGVSPHRCIYAGDKLAVDVVGARSAGMNAVLIDRVGAFPHADCIRGSDLNIFRRFL